MQLQRTAKFISATVLMSAIGLSLGIGQASGAEVALVESVSGRVVAFAAGKPTLLDALDVVSEGTQLDLQANSELRICHYKMRQFLTLRGPLRASISLDGVAVENRKTVLEAAGSCTAPARSTYSGGIVIRGVVPIPVSDVSGKR